MVKDKDWFLTNKLPHTYIYIYIQYLNTCIKLNDFKTLHKIMTLRSTSAELHINIYMKCLVHGLLNCFDTLKWIRKIPSFYVSSKGENISHYSKNHKSFMGLDSSCVSNNLHLLWYFVFDCQKGKTAQIKNLNLTGTE